MKSNKLTPTSNLRWESSRMILPEWRKQWLQRQEAQTWQDPPEMDDQMMEEYMQIIHDGMAYTWLLEVTYWQDGQFHMTTGYVARFRDAPPQIWFQVGGAVVVIPVEHLQAVAVQS
ncbi:YolD-like family protein [uncultured Marinococcus sp.]|uniref:YolD-like family protein n=1 Tax=uncultured Marinococcus sp. TaxID=487012 RepID=UPI00260515B7|nr:YolD-like family protein [uncultured Marinococcus sp.]